ncbi:MAG: TadE family protein [Terriglobia bacterium]
MRFTCLRLRTIEKTQRLFSGTTGERGAEIVEFAFVAPLLITLVLGIFWVGRAYNTYQTITHAAREGARYAAAPTCATCAGATLQSCGTGMGIPAGRNAFPGQSGGSSDPVRAVVNCALAADSLDPSLIRDFTDSTSTPLNSDPAPNQELGVVVSFDYPVSFPIPFVKISPIKLTTQVQMRQEY